MKDSKVKPYISIADHIWNMLPEDPNVLEAMLKTGAIYTPYVGLQVTKLVPASKKG